MNVRMDLNLETNRRFHRVVNIMELGGLLPRPQLFVRNGRVILKKKIARIILVIADISQPKYKFSFYIRKMNDNIKSLCKQILESSIPEKDITPNRKNE